MMRERYGNIVAYFCQAAEQLPGSLRALIGLSHCPAAPPEGSVHHAHCTGVTQGPFTRTCCSLLGRKVT